MLFYFQFLSLDHCNPDVSVRLIDIYPGSWSCPVYPIAYRPDPSNDHFLLLSLYHGFSDFVHSRHYNLP